MCPPETALTTSVYAFLQLLPLVAGSRPLCLNRFLEAVALTHLSQGP